MRALSTLRLARTLPCAVSAIGSRGFASDALTELVRDFVNPETFVNHLRDKGVNFFTGVPDSLLKDFASCVDDTTPAEDHIMTANEGAAIGLAAGHHMATGKTPLVYLQNSGLGNTINPLLSLADPQVYGIPMLIVVGWRGEPGKKDEPQHILQGKVTPGMLASMGIPFEVLPDYDEGAMEAVDNALAYCAQKSAPYVLLVRRQNFEKYASTKEKLQIPGAELSREALIELVTRKIGEWDIVVSSTGFTSREVFEMREKNSDGDHSRDFLTVGSMGHSSAIGLGIALRKPSRNVWVLDGDGSCQMHLGTMCTVGQRQPKNFKHIVINNGVHDSVGGQTTGMIDMDIPMIADGCKYKTTISATSAADIEAGIEKLMSCEGPALLEARVSGPTRPDLGRPTATPQQNKLDFMQFLQE